MRNGVPPTKTRVQLGALPTALTGTILLGLGLYAGYLHTGWVTSYRCPSIGT